MTWRDEAIEQAMRFCSVEPGQPGYDDVRADVEGIVDAAARTLHQHIERLPDTLPPANMIDRDDVLALLGKQEASE